MHERMIPAAPAPWVVLGIAACLFGLVLVMMETGRRIGKRHYTVDPKSAGKGVAPLDGAVFGLMGLLIAFTFSGAGARLDERRKLIVRETNAIGTAYLRLSLLPQQLQPGLRENLRRYLDARLDFYRYLATDPAAAERAEQQTANLQKVIWNEAMLALHSPEITGTAPAILIVPSINEMFDMATTQEMAIEIHPPAIVYSLLLVLVLGCSLLAGYGAGARRNRSWLHTVAFASILIGSIYVIFDYEYPRAGLIRVDAADRMLIKLRNGMEAAP
jgi:hypothetical protein